MSSLSSRPQYTRQQLAKWLQLINQGTSDLSLEKLESEIQQDPLGTLGKLQLWQLAAIPFGNIILHYSSHHKISLDPETLFDKIVTRQLGGYCMENNAFFATVLRSLGYQLYTTGARISNQLDPTAHPEGYSGWSHQVILVDIAGTKYMVDVGFGTTGSISPLKLQDGVTSSIVPTAESRLLRKAIAPATDQSQLMWVLEVRNDPQSGWSSQYCFSELEFLPEDFAVMSYQISQSRTSWFLQMLVLTKLILNEDRTAAIGTLTIMKEEVKERLEGKSTVLLVCENEKERVQALDTYFGVKLNADEARGIQGLPSEIKKPWKE